MSTETLKYYGKIEKNSLDAQIAVQCAPLITGLKASNLLIIDKSRDFAVKNLFENSRIELYLLYSTNKKNTYILFNRDKLEKNLFNIKSMEIINIFSFENTLDEILEVIRINYGNFMGGNLDFPHELGILLDYPPEDVIGFIENKGANAIYTGYWKVYSNLQEKINTFRLFDLALNKLIRLISTGNSISEIMKIYARCHNLIRI